MSSFEHRTVENDWALWCIHDSEHLDWKLKRRQAGLRQQDIADLVGVPQQIVARFEKGENGHAKPTEDTLGLEYSAILGIPVDETSPRRKTLRECPPETFVETTTPDEIVERNELGELAMNALDLLEERDKNLVLQRVVYGKRYQEIEPDTSATMMCYRMKRSLAILKEALEER